MIGKCGKTFRADYHVAACDPKVLYETLLNGHYPDPEFEKRYNNPDLYPLTSNIYVGIGYEKYFAPQGHTVMTFAINQFQPELDAWEVLRKDKEAYMDEKSLIGDADMQDGKAGFYP